MSCAEDTKACMERDIEAIRTTDGKTQTEGVQRWDVHGQDEHDLVTVFTIQTIKFPYTDKSVYVAEVINPSCGDRVYMNAHYDLQEAKNLGADFLSRHCQMAFDVAISMIEKAKKALQPEADRSLS